MDSREQARKCFEEQGERLTDIAERLGINYNTIKQWKSRYKWKQAVTKKRKKKVTKRVTSKSENQAVEKSAPDKPDGSLELTEKQRLFAEIYIRNFNATQAAIKAGYSPETAYSIGYENLKKPQVREYINQLKEMKKDSIMVGENDIIERYMRIAFADMTDFAEFGSEKAVEVDRDGGETEVDRDYFRFRDSKAVDGGLICEVKKSRQGMSIKLKDWSKAMDWLVKFFDMNPEHKYRKEFDGKKMQLEQERFLHQKDMDSKKDW